MDAAEIDRALSAAEAELARGRKPDLTSTGFWRAVAAAKRRSELTARYAERIARLDRTAFERAVPLRVPAALGVALDVAGTIVGVALIAIAGTTAPPGQAAFWMVPPWREVVFLAGVSAILGTTHTLAHWVVGSLVGIRFTHWYSRPPLTPQPGFKVDYASYLRAPAAARAWMHASGAVVTKLVPFAAYPFALQAGLEPWATWVLLVLGVLQLVTDATLSTRASDWKKFRREMRFAR